MVAKKEERKLFLLSRISNGFLEGGCRSRSNSNYGMKVISGWGDEEWPLDFRGRESKLQ